MTESVGPYRREGRAVRYVKSYTDKPQVICASSTSALSGRRVSQCNDNLFRFYRPQRSWGKVIFSQACVILLTGGRCLVLGCLVPGVGWCLVPGRGDLVWGVPGPGGSCPRGVPGGDPNKRATAAGSTHPAGMHSCCFCFCFCFCFFFEGGGQWRTSPFYVDFWTPVKTA